MRIFVTSAIIVSLLAVVFYRLFKTVPDEEAAKDRSGPLLMSLAVLALCVDLLTGEKPVEIVMVDIMPALAGMLVLVSSLWERSEVRMMILAASVATALPVVINVAFALKWIDDDMHWVGGLCLMAASIAVTGQFFAGICRRMKSVKRIVKTGTVWTNVGLAVDSIYVLATMTWVLAFIVGYQCCGGVESTVLYVFPFLLGVTLAAAGMREADDVVFILWRSQERRIMESMKVTKVETALDPAGIDDVYQDIYERIVAYFEAEKPFLDNSLTINDLVKVLYSNKLYISRAISQFTGRNFCQFVNFYRVRYSMELFRANSDMKIHELAVGCGFNSDVSYNMAFRLFMGETPGEWCRKERSRKIKMKK